MNVLQFSLAMALVVAGFACKPQQVTTVPDEVAQRGEPDAVVLEETPNDIATENAAPFPGWRNLRRSCCIAAKRLSERNLGRSSCAA